MTQSRGAPGWARKRDRAIVRASSTMYSDVTADETHVDAMANSGHDAAGSTNRYELLLSLRLDM